MRVHFKIDSTVVVCCINKQTSCNYEILTICQEKDLQVYTSNKSTKEDKSLDKESRKIRYKLEYLRRKTYTEKQLKTF